MLPQSSVCMVFFAPQILASVFVKKHSQMKKKSWEEKQRSSSRISSIQFLPTFMISYSVCQPKVDNASLSAGLQIELTNLMFTLNTYLY